MLTKSGLIELTRQLGVFSRDAIAKNQLGYLVTERVTVVVEDMVALGLVLVCHVAEHLKENFLGHLCLAEGNCFCWLA